MGEMDALRHKRDWLQRVGQEANDAMYHPQMVEVRIARLEALVCALVSDKIDEIDAQIAAEQEPAP